MRKILSYLAIHMTVALIAIIGWQLYYLFFQTPKTKTPDNQNVTISVPTTEPTGSRNPLAELRNALVSSTIINDYEGVIVEIDKKGGAVKLGNISFQYEVKIILEGKLGKTAPFFLDRKTLNITKVKKIVDNKEEDITINDLNIQDNVRIKFTRGLDQATGSINFFEVIIIKS